METAVQFMVKAIGSLLIVLCMTFFGPDLSARVLGGTPLVYLILTIALAINLIDMFYDPISEIRGRSRK